MATIYCERVFVKDFSHAVSKQAYLKACKWLAKNVYSNVELAQDLVVNIIKKNECESPTFTVTVYVLNNESELRSDFCKKCRSLHTLFYSLRSMNCNECKAKAYHKKMDEEIANKAQFVKQVLEEKENV